MPTETLVRREEWPGSARGGGPSPAGAEVPPDGPPRRAAAADAGDEEQSPAGSGKVSVNKYEQQWNENYRKLKQYKEEHGHCKVPSHYAADPKLGRWVSVQRRFYSAGKLLKQRKELLSEIGFRWRLKGMPTDGRKRPAAEGEGPRSAPTQKKQRTKQDPSAPAMAKPPASASPSGGNRQKQPNKPLPPRPRNNEAWNMNYQKLLDYKEEHGHCNVPFHYALDPKLGRWVAAQRQNYSAGKLLKQRKELLSEIGFRWTVIIESWKEQYQMLRRYKEEHGHFNIPERHVVDGVKLGKWVAYQRYCYKAGKLSEQRQQQLNEIGFDWALGQRINSFNEAWNMNYQKLLDYKEEHGHCNVTIDYPADPKLGRWVAAQRKNYSAGKLLKQRKELLSEIGFRWTVNIESWKEQYQMLRRYKEEHGHFNIPHDFVVDGVKLGKWVAHQRYCYKAGKLLEQRQQQLNEIGFDWALAQSFNESWNMNYQKLLDYKEEHGHCNVPQDFVVDGVKLGVWVAAQRRNYSAGKLLQQRMGLLSEIGFRWRLKGMPTDGRKRPAAEGEGPRSASTQKKQVGGDSAQTFQGWETV